MKNCCIEGCQVSSETNVTLFEFPTSRMLRKRWLDAINPSSKLAVDALICSQHFAEEDYEAVRGKIRLKGKVVPRLFTDEAPKAQNSISPQDPLGLPDTTETSKEHNTNENLNGYVENNDTNNTENVDGNKEIHKESKSPGEDGKEVSNNVNVDRNNENVGDENVAQTDGNVKDSENVADENVAQTDGNDKDNAHFGDETVAQSDGNVKHENVAQTDGNVDSENVGTLNGEQNVAQTDANIVKDNENVGNANIAQTDGNVVKDNVNVAQTDSNVGSDNVAQNVRDKKVKKIIVPMGRVAGRNGHLDSDSSQDSYTSVAVPPLILEDLEEQLPNYQIANMKTERQIAAMTETLDPVEETPMEEDVEEVVIEPPQPVFIELSVGQDGNSNLEQPNDCLMVLESVMCDIDPTLMLEARAEDEECCEQIDLDDDDDDDVVVTETPVDTRTTDNTNVPKRPKSPVDPISLLTSSDEDDVIVQEPHIDTLSVSDETDEDDLPLQKLIKRTKKTKAKKKKKSRPETVKNILRGANDFFCTHCQYTSPDYASHKRHLRTHKSKKQETNPATKVYQICKECGYTTSSKSQLLRHQRKHLKEKKYKCPLCTYRSKYNMSLLYHLKTHDFDPNMYNCWACGLELDNTKELIKHQKGCKDMGRFVCDNCDFVGTSERDLKLHKSSVHK